MPEWVADGLTLAELVTIIGALGAIAVLIRAIRGLIHLTDAAGRLFAALEDEFTPNGGRVILADDAHATTKDLLLDMRNAFVNIQAGQSVHEDHAEERTRRIVAAIKEGSVVDAVPPRA